MATERETNTTQPDSDTTQPGLSKLSDVAARITAQLSDPVYQAEAARRRREHEAYDARQRQSEMDRRRDALWQARGRRYAGCTLDNYVCDNKAQEAVLSAVREYRDALADRIAAGVNLILTGPSGTGKDHLLAALFNATIDAGHWIVWTSGANLFATLRDAIGKETNESETLRPYLRCGVLVLSDPVPIAGELSNYQRSMLYQIVDTRYNQCKPIWATINAVTREEAQNVIGTAIVDRLRDGALSLACNWKSHRSPLQ